MLRHELIEAPERGHHRFLYEIAGIMQIPGACRETAASPSFEARPVATNQRIQSRGLPLPNLSKKNQRGKRFFRRWATRRSKLARTRGVTCMQWFLAMRGRFWGRPLPLALRQTGGG